MWSKKKRTVWIVGIIVAICMVCVVGFFVYTMDYYHAEQKALQALVSSDEVTVTEREDGGYNFVPIVDGNTESIGLIFYPGGKVEEEAYAPLMHQLAENGILCVLVDAPFRLMVLDMDAAEGIQAEYPQITRWYIGGHSLGGSMAAAYLEENDTAYEGLFLCASYSTTDLHDTDLQVLSVYGSHDEVLNREKYQEALVNLPADYTEHIIDGGNHAGFGDYGEQKGDGKAQIPGDEQIKTTVDLFLQACKTQESK